MLIAVHPREAAEILRAMDDAGSDEEGLAPRLSDEELEEAARRRRSIEEIESAIADLRRFGLHVSNEPS